MFKECAIMPSKDRRNTWFLKETIDYLDVLKKKLADILGIDVSRVNRKHAEKAMIRLSKRGSITKKEAEDIYIGRI